MVEMVQLQLVIFIAALILYELLLLYYCITALIVTSEEQNVSKLTYSVH